ncbi:helix-turn-helix domain-containing protein [Nocardioides sp.]|uniref:helix-turn-helix domain-containing protein n=1 Tax=Nocardioides sp. TaxID=35761 RepID=UPI0026162F6C|nr:helix-turn-helix domain-containing protein [Nocardioides sp.]
MDSEERARRLHLSRFHLDRIVSAVAGEPPERMRRRLLLERAAYQLAVTDRQVLDVALEAGFGSHEAFTRAFTKAYGAPPAHWRRRPGRTQIPAPSEVHVHPPGSVGCPPPRR